jgi:hypothetical protein
MMNTMLLATKWKWISAVIGLSLIAESVQAAPSSDFKRLLAHPAAFHGKRVTLTGVAKIGGSEFFLYPDVSALRDSKPAVFVAQNPRGAMYDKFNNHWLKVTGIVNAKGHGPLGGDTCELRLERVEPLPRPSLPDRNIYGVFRNEGPATVTLKVSAPSGYSVFDIPPHFTAPPGVISNGTVEVTTRSGKLLAKANLLPRGAAERYFDNAHRTYYYRVTEKTIDLVWPSETTRWDVYWPTDIVNTPK